MNITISYDVNLYKIKYILIISNCKTRNLNSKLYFSNLYIVYNVYKLIPNNTFD